MYNLEFPALAFQVACFSWAVYLFNSGHSASMISKRNLPFDVLLVCDPYAYERALFNKFTGCRCILPSAATLLDHICGSGDQSLLDGYLIHSHRYQTSEPTNVFWSLQASIVAQLQAIWKLHLFVAFVHPDHDSRSVSKFVTQLTKSGWVISSTKCSFPEDGDSVVGTMTIVVGVHINTQAKLDALMFCTPPSRRPLWLAAFVWQPFNKKEYGLSFAREDSSFNDGSMPPLHAAIPSASVLSLLLRGLRYIICICRAPTPPSLMVLPFFHMTAFALRLTVCRPQTFSNATLELSFTMMITPTFNPSHHLSSRRALGSLISCNTNFPSMATGSRLMQAFLL
jgi:hypothetical protein